MRTLLFFFSLSSSLAMAQGASFNAASWNERTGYFVMTETTYDGDLGGLDGANSACLTELNAKNWRGKGTIKLDAAHVKAFLCGSTCNNPQANTGYVFARAGQPTIGGSIMRINASGLGPQDSLRWDDAAHFNENTRYWMGRPGGTATTWSNSGDGSCYNFLVTHIYVFNFTGTVGKTDNSDGKRFNESTVSCDNDYPLICMVHPN